ncbi:MAG: branched-chain amino acid ABC transporter permease [Gammaproteobacteria bacterium]|nr:branched-chain amino acid ABC transporter permease [Gammaproteobacteria bacterium]MYE99673.1 branched-chain amino acid ABC transporter permease [Gammaproteobacteria bacterium]MYG96205.1 branched-chain amino acid ABC transporter permease [Gammaproteobacteria bacterium]
MNGVNAVKTLAAKSGVWAGYLAVLLLLPQLFDSILAISIFNQMAIAIVFALSYNMLLGQGGMLSFGHAVYFGLGGFLAVHALLMMENEAVYFSIAFIPLIGGLTGLLAGVFVGSFSTRKAGTVFAMISLGIGELVAASSLIFTGFFGGEAGVSGDRTFGPPLFGMDFFSDVDVYYLAAFWVFLSTLFMYLFTQTPAGRMANAVRDNPERAEFIGYSARWVRFISFCASGMFAGVAGGLFALNYEFLTDENLNLVTSGRVLLMAYIGGLGFFIGPIIGAIVLTLMNFLLSNYTELWLLYLGIMFLLTVLFLPRGFAGFIMMHRLAWLRGRLHTLVLPYLLTGLPALLFILCVICLLELSHTAEPELHFLGLTLAQDSVLVWAGLLLFATLGWYLTKKSAPGLRRAWEAANEPEADAAQEQVS